MVRSTASELLKSDGNSPLKQPGPLKLAIIVQSRSNNVGEVSLALAVRTEMFVVGLSLRIVELMI